MATDRDCVDVDVRCELLTPQYVKRETSDFEFVGDLAQFVGGDPC